MFFFRRRILCPYCLAELRTRGEPETCPSCKAELPVQYIHDYEQHQPFFAQVFGWSRAGKTVFQYALTLMLMKMANVWPKYTFAPATNATLVKTQEINSYLQNGVMPPMTQMGDQEVYVMLLRNMERWGGRTLVMRDCAGEIFDTMEVPVKQAPYLLNAPTTFMFLSLPDLPNSKGRSIDHLLNNYINTLMKHKVNFAKEQRKLVVVFTKADLIQELPANLRNYLINDPLWAAVNARGSVNQLDTLSMAAYVETMMRVSDAVQDWVGQDFSGKTFIRLAQQKNVDLRFSLISSTGTAVGEDGAMVESLAPRRVLDPFFWALELQSKA
jgi:hypothetical protein